MVSLESGSIIATELYEILQHLTNVLHFLGIHKPTVIHVHVYYTHIAYTTHDYTYVHVHL